MWHLLSPNIDFCSASITAVLYRNIGLYWTGLQQHLHDDDNMAAFLQTTAFS